MAKNIKILVIDDNLEYVDKSLRVRAREKPFLMQLDHAENLEDGLDLWNKNGGERIYSGIILDIICLKNRNQKVPKRDFLPKALQAFAEVAPSYIPRAILTAESERIEEHKEIYEATAKVYSKERKGVTDLLHYLKNAANNLEDNRVKDSHPEIFKIFEKEFLKPEIEQDLIACLKNMKSSNLTTIRQTLGTLRTINEGIFTQLSIERPEILPKELMIENKYAPRPAIVELLRQGIVDRGSIVHENFEYTWNIQSAHGSHKSDHRPTDKPSNKPTRYTVQSCVHAMMDLLLWFKKVMEESQ